MLSITETSKDRYGLVRAGEAWRNGSGIATLLGTFVAFSALVVLGTAGNPPVIVAMAGLTGWLVLLVGGTAAGMQFMQQATGMPVDRPAAALVASPPVLLRTLGLAAATMALVLAFALVAALLLALCRIPGLGEVLYMLLLPLLTLGASALCLVLAVAVLLVAPALWEGCTLRFSFEQFVHILIKRPKEAALGLALLLVLGAFAVAVVLGLMSLGFGLTVGLSALVVPHLSIQYGPGSVGMSIVVGIATALMSAFLYMGLALTYLKLARGLEVGDLRGLVRKAMTQAGKPAAEPAAWTRAACPTCGHDIAATDAFCGHCGRRVT